jgi:hypothetical protein
MRRCRVKPISRREGVDVPAATAPHENLLRHVLGFRSVAGDTKRNRNDSPVLFSEKALEGLAR